MIARSVPSILDMWQFIENKEVCNRRRSDLDKADEEENTVILSRIIFRNLLIHYSTVVSCHTWELCRFPAIMLKTPCLASILAPARKPELEEVASEDADE
jgi:hypothetical protein